MSRKIIGVTVGTTMNPQRVGEQLENGKSAYELALENGFKGTEVEWLASLKGATGATGPRGENGKDGYIPVKGKDYFDGKDGADGQPGKDGSNGKDGKDGADGRTPVKGTDYFTEADKAEMVSAVISALPKYDGEVVSV